MSKKDGKIRFINYFSYGMNDFIGAGAFALTSAWLLYFYTTFCGLTPIEASSIFALARIVDAVASPTMGFITDNFHKTALGRKIWKKKILFISSNTFNYCIFSYLGQWFLLFILCWDLYSI